MEESGLFDAKSVSTRMANNSYDEKAIHDEDEVQKDRKFRNIIGSLLFLATRSRPDVATS